MRFTAGQFTAIEVLQESESYARPELFESITAATAGLDDLPDDGLCHAQALTIMEWTIAGAAGAMCAGDIEEARRRLIVAERIAALLERARVRRGEHPRPYSTLSSATQVAEAGLDAETLTLDLAMELREAIEWDIIEMYAMAEDDARSFEDEWVRLQGPRLREYTRDPEWLPEHTAALNVTIPRLRELWWDPFSRPRMARIVQTPGQPLAQAFTTFGHAHKEFWTRVGWMDNTAHRLQVFIDSQGAAPPP